MQRQYDPRESDTHRALLETPDTLAYLPHALRWSLKLEVLFVSVLFGTALGLFAGLLVGLWIFILLGSGVLFWLLAVLSRAVWGFGDPPRVDAHNFVSVTSAALWLLLLAILIVSAYSGIKAASPVAATGFAWIAGLLLPSMFALLAVEGSLVPALNPVRILRVLLAGGVLGWLLAILSAMLLDAGLRALFPAVSELQPERLLMFAPTAGKIAGTIIGIWALSLLMHLYGHALHHRHEVAGLGVILAAPDDDERADKRRAGVVERMADALEDAHRRGDRTAAEQLAAAAPPDDVDTLAYYADLWERLHLERKYAVALLVAQRLLPVAVERKRNKLAYDILLEAWKLSPGFEPGPGVRLALARYLQALGDHAGFDRVSDVDPAAWPDDPDAVELAGLRSYWLEGQDPR